MHYPSDDEIYRRGIKPWLAELDWNVFLKYVTFKHPFTNQSGLLDSMISFRTVKSLYQLFVGSSN